MRISLLLIAAFAGFFLLILNAVMLVVIFFTRRKMDKTQGWPSTNGVITASSAATGASTASGGSEGSMEYPVVRYSYQVGGQAFEGTQIAPGPEVGGSAARMAAGRYETGAPVTVFYNPRNPGEAVLERNAPSQRVMWLVLALFDCVICAAAPVVYWAIANQ